MSIEITVDSISKLAHEASLQERHGLAAVLLFLASGMAFGEDSEPFRSLVDVMEIVMNLAVGAERGWHEHRDQA